MSKIVLTGPLKGKTKVLSKLYQFTEGVMEIDNEEDAQKIFSYLKKYYPVSMAGAAEEAAPTGKPEVASAPQVAAAAKTTPAPAAK